MVGKFVNSTQGYTHMLVAVDKFTKWIKAKPIKKCDGKTVVKFIRELIYRYGYPHSIITDNVKNFAKGDMVYFCDEHGIRLDLASVAHPESNGQAERANQSVLLGLKPRLLAPNRASRRLLGGGTLLRPLGNQHLHQSLNRLHAILHGIRSRGSHAN